MKIEKLVVASHNQGKINEIKTMLAPFQVSVVSAAELNLPDVEETGTTFEENAKLKSETLARLSHCFCLADDSGLCVNCLGGRPGVYSARYAPDRDFDKGITKLLDEIRKTNSSDFSAYFACVLALTSPEGETQTFSAPGRCTGTGLFCPENAAPAARQKHSRGYRRRGSSGLKSGYDPRPAAAGRRYAG